MERLEIIKNAKGPTLRSKLVAVCEALLASGVADAPRSRNAPGSEEEA